MQATVAINDALIAEAESYTGLHDTSALVNEGLKALVERESARRLARLGGTEPDLRLTQRRRATAA